MLSTLIVNNQIISLEGEGIGTIETSHVALPTLHMFLYLNLKVFLSLGYFVIYMGTCFRVFMSFHFGYLSPHTDINIFTYVVYVMLLEHSTGIWKSSRLKGDGDRVCHAQRRKRRKTLPAQHLCRKSDLAITWSSKYASLGRLSDISSPDLCSLCRTWSWASTRKQCHHNDDLLKTEINIVKTGAQWFILFPLGILIPMLSLLSWHLWSIAIH